ncbi:amidohydrolase [Arthrobacter sp. ISL-48]|uniref:amidohydrolase family protein n=1 Tax=Arthrobacter sp. ISL-48 TaxID=2819110 RepID=UPI001BE67FD4|nr:amidohydrolase family protein [Arthrobacter sp. ISL-48]MBT2533681.1 amidohydrolase [Arthrobacter sp. ISL-48]
MIDSHLHLWELPLATETSATEVDAAGQSGAPGAPRRPYAWLGPQHGSLFRSFGEQEAQETLVDAGVRGAVLVQADDTLADTESMLAAADRNDWVLAVVGWIPLEHPDLAQAELERLGANPKFRGVRHLVHDDPRDDFLELPGVRESLRLVADRGLALDIPDAYPRHLHRAVALARDLPELTVVLDHLGKPPLTDAMSAGRRPHPELERWRREFRALAGQPNTVAKVSGLHLPGLEYTATALRPLWEEALAAFGPERLMIGMDWPVSTLGAPYHRTLEVLLELAADLDPAARHAFLEGTAARTYGLRTPESALSKPERPESENLTRQDEVKA